MRRGGGGGGKGRSGLLPSSLRIISSCLKSVSSNAGSVAGGVRSAGAAVAASMAAPTVEAERDQVLWAGFDKLELGSSTFKHVLLLGYVNGFQVLDVDDACDVCEMVSKRDGPVTYLQVQPTPFTSEGNEGFKASHPLLLVVAGDETNGSGLVQGGRLSALIRDNTSEPQNENCVNTPTVVRFYSLKSHTYVHVLRFRSAIYMVRCSPRIVAVALAAQIYCFDPVTFENKFSVLTYPLQGAVGVNIGYGPMSVGSRWLAYASDNPLFSNLGRLSPQNLTPSPGVSPLTSPSNGSVVARYAMESSKQLAAGILNLGDMGYKTLSKYYQEHLPDGSSSPLSPLSSNSSRRLGRASPSHPSDADNAGMVVVKDFVSKEVVSQFRAHTSPISALCFDPSGTLLVTASVHGHNINVFRIMPRFISNGSGSVCYDWASSHAHLYKLYRGLTTAVIQDICFSHFSQWVAIVSSRGTCHIFVLSPFGGDASLQQQTTHTDGPSLVPNLTLPWWSTSSSSVDQTFISPPSPMTLSVISRIKNSNSGWLNTVSNVAASATGKVLIPSGAMAAAFHNSLYYSAQQVHSTSNSLEHLLVYSPSGQLIQYKLTPSVCVESSDSSSRTSSGSFLQLQDDELRVNAEPVQWWDVWRRSNRPEREEAISRFFVKNKQYVVAVMDTSDYEDSDTSSISSSICTAGNGKTNGRPYWYLSNAEVQVKSGRIPIWQETKICFYVLDSLGTNRKYTTDSTGGEVEIEQIPFHEAEMRRKDVLTALDQFHTYQSFWVDRTHARGVGQDSPSEAGKEVIIDSSTVTDPESAPLQTGSDVVSLHSMEKPIQSNSIHKSSPMAHCEIVDEISSTKYSGINSLMDGHVINDLSSHNSPEVRQYFLEGYCGISDSNGIHESTEGVIDNSTEDVDNDDMLDGIFSFSEEDMCGAG